MGAVSHSRGPAGSGTRLTRARATAGSGGRVGGRHFQQVSREDQEPSPTSVGHVMPTRAPGGPAFPPMVPPGAMRSSYCVVERQR